MENYLYLFFLFYFIIVFISKKKTKSVLQELDEQQQNDYMIIIKFVNKKHMPIALILILVLIISVVILDDSKVYGYLIFFTIVLILHIFYLYELIQKMNKIKQSNKLKKVVVAGQLLEILCLFLCVLSLFWSNATR